MEIKNYECFFHDGSINNILQTGKNIDFFIESGEILPAWNKENVILSKNNTLIGVLSVINNSFIKVNGLCSCGLKMNYDDGEILKLNIDGNKLFIIVKWLNYPPKKIVNITDCIEIEAENFLWKIL